MHVSYVPKGNKNSHERKHLVSYEFAFEFWEGNFTYRSIRVPQGPLTSLNVPQGLSGTLMYLHGHTGSFRWSQGPSGSFQALFKLLSSSFQDPFRLLQVLFGSFRLLQRHQRTLAKDNLSRYNITLWHALVVDDSDCRRCLLGCQWDGIVLLGPIVNLASLPKLIVCHIGTMPR